MGDPTWTDVLGLSLLLLFLSSLWWAIRQGYGSSWCTHALAVVIVIIAAMTIEIAVRQIIQGRLNG
jgi:hypothetical protein